MKADFYGKKNNIQNFESVSKWIMCKVPNPLSQTIDIKTSKQKNRQPITHKLHKTTQVFQQNQPHQYRRQKILHSTPHIYTLVRTNNSNRINSTYASQLSAKKTPTLNCCNRSSIFFNV